MLSGDAGLNLGSPDMDQPSSNNYWDVSKARGLHFITLT